MQKINQLQNNIYNLLKKLVLTDKDSVKKIAEVPKQLAE